MSKLTVKMTPVPEKLTQIFQNLGFTEKSAKIYQLLLTRNHAKVAYISQQTGIKRSNTYALLKELVTHDLIHEFEKSGILYYQASEPEKLAVLAEKKSLKMASTAQDAQLLSKELKKQWKTAVGRPTIQYYEGESGITKVFDDIYAKKTTPVYGCVDLEIANQVFPARISKELIPKRVKNQVFAYSLIGESPSALELKKQDHQQLRKTLLIDKNNYPLPAEIDVYEDKISFISFEKGEFIAIIIENQQFAESLRSIFKIAFHKNMQ